MAYRSTNTFAFILACCVLPASALANVFALDFPVELDGRTTGTLVIGTDGRTLVYVDAASLETFAEDRLTDSLLQAMLARARDGRIPAGALSDIGVGIELDQVRAVVEMTVPEDRRRVEAIGLGRSGVDFESIGSGATLEGFLNLAATQEIVVEDTGAGAARLPFTLAARGGLRLFGPEGLYLEGSAFVEEGADDDGVVRGPVRLVHDDLERAIRYVAGDLDYDLARFQGGPELLGVSASRAFSDLQPLRSISSSGSEIFSIRRPSRVAVFVNGVFQRSLRLEPGTYSLAEFGFVSGLNEIRLEITDATGATEILEFSLFLDATLLEPGLTTFSLNAGFRHDREHDGDGIRYDFEAPAWTGFVRHGVTGDLTLGAAYQGDRDLHVGGVEAVAGTPAGIVSAIGAVSRSAEHGRGYAAEGRWSFDIDMPDAIEWSDRTSVDLGARYESRDFLLLGEADPTNDIAYEIFGRLTTDLPLETTLALTGRWARPRDRALPPERSAGIAIGRGFGAFTAQIRYQYGDTERPEHLAFATLSIPLGRASTVRTSWRSENNETALEYTRFGDDVVGDLSGGARVEASEDGIEGAAEIRYLGNRGVLAAAYDGLQSGFEEGDRTQRVRLGAGTAIAFSDASVAWGRPVADTFAIVKRHPTLENAKVLVEPNRDGAPEAIADMFGPALVTGRRAYIPGRIRWTVPDAPIGYDLGGVEGEVFLPEGAGAAFEVGTAASYTAVGVALGRDGEPLSLIAGRVLAADGRDFPVQATFTNRAGRFAAQSLEPGAYVVRFADGPSFDFTIPEEGENFVDLGILGAGP